MNIFIDIGHPAHVHYFKNFIKHMSLKGHSIYVFARDKEVTHVLLNKYKINYISRGQGGHGLIGKLFYVFKTDLFIIKKLKSINIDIFLSFASPYAAHVAWYKNKPHICIDDTEHAKFNHLIYRSFTKVILTPSCFQKNFGKKQIKIHSYSELFYLHPKYFSPSINIIRNTGIKENEKYALLRFVSFNANHDIGQKGIDTNTRKKIVDILVRNNYRVLISSEEQVVDYELRKYLIHISPENIHHFIAFSNILISEGATMASEGVMLGVPTIYVNTLNAGTLIEQENKYKLLHNFRNSSGVVEKLQEILNNPFLKKMNIENRKKLLDDKINFTEFLIWFIENHPQSIKIMKDSPEYQWRFK